MSGSYHETRLTKDRRRDVLWRTLWRLHLRRHVPEDGCVLDLGCGYGDFINNVTARRRLAVDTWSEMPRHVAPGVEAHVGSIVDLDWIEDGSIDLALASNLFEHVTREDFATCLQQLGQRSG